MSFQHTNFDPNARLTAVNHNYPTCDRTCAKFRKYPSTGTHERITELLGISPTSSGTMGDRRNTARGAESQTRRTHWIFSTEANVSSRDLRAHLDWLLDLIEDKSPVISQLSREMGTKMDINCIWWSASGHGGPTLWPEQMGRIAVLGLELGFDIQFHDSD